MADREARDSAGPANAEVAEIAGTVIPEQPPNLFCPDGIFFPAEEYEVLLSVLLKYVSRENFDFIGQTVLPDREAVFRAYGDRCAALRMSIPRMQRLFYMGVRPEDVVERPLILDMSSEPSSPRSELLLSLRASGHFWIAPVVPLAERPAAVAVQRPQPAVEASLPTSGHKRSGSGGKPEKVKAGGGGVKKRSKPEKGEDDEVYVNYPIAEAAADELAARLSTVTEPADALRSSRRELRVAYAEAEEDDDPESDDEGDDASTQVQARGSGKSPPRTPRTPRIADNGDEDHADIRQRDLFRLHRYAGVWIVRFYRCHIEPRLSDGIIPPAASLRMFKQLLLEARSLVRYAIQLVSKPLCAVSIFHHEKARNTRLVEVNRVMRSGAVHPVAATWVVPLDNPAYFRTCNGYLDNGARSLLLDNFFLPVRARIDELLDLLEAREDPNYVAGVDDQWDPDLGPPDEDGDSDDDDAVDRHAARARQLSSGSYSSPQGTPQSSSSPPPRRAGSSSSQTQGGGSAVHTMAIATGLPPQALSPLSPAADFAAASRSIGGISGTSLARSDSTADKHVTAEEMLEFWLRPFGNVSLLTQPAYKVDHRARANLIEKCPVLQSLAPLEVLKFLEYLSRVEGQTLNVAFPWVQVIASDLVPAILGAFEQCFLVPCLENLADVNPKQLVKVLGRMCEVKYWSAFVNRTRPLFQSYVWERANCQDFQWAWQQISGVVQKLQLVIPFFGRNVGRGGGTINKRDSTFARFFVSIVPGYVADPILDEIYSPSFAHINVSYGLDEDPSRWDFGADHSKLLRVLLHYATREGQEDRIVAERKQAFNNMQERLSKPARAHSIEDIENDEAYGNQESDLSSMPASTSVARNRAYGGSGSGQPSDRLHKVIERSAERANSLCFKFASNGSCARGDTCMFVHPKQPTEEMLEFLRAELAKTRSRDDRSRDDRPSRMPARHHNLEPDLDLEVTALPDEPFVLDQSDSLAAAGKGVRFKEE